MFHEKVSPLNVFYQNKDVNLRLMIQCMPFGNFENRQ